ncbi:MAG: esterase/lipase family protein [Burkholderiales bacterium]
MARRQVVIIHGWSDTSRSFQPLVKFLTHNGYEAKLLWLGDYISQDDDVRVEDVAKRMNELVREKIRRRELSRNFDVIAHSTGALVARAWLTTWYHDDPEECPMKRLVMLAPANYGSKLAATGKSVLGRVFKGYNNWFETGQSMLNDLELASPYQWELAQRDVLVAPHGDPANFYGDGLIWPFVITGTHPYTSMMRQIVNENGSDGTVRVCAANLNARGVTLDFRQSDARKIRIPWGSKLEAEVPLAVLPTRTHGSIIDPERALGDNQEDIVETPEEKALLGKLILQALACENFDAYQSIQASWDQISEETAARRDAPGQQHPEIYHQYMQGNFAARDDQGAPVTDYMLEFFSNTDKRHDEANVYMQSQVIEEIKRNTQNAALRNVLFDRTDLMEGYYAKLPAGTEPILYLSISAAAPGRNIAYFSSQKTGAEGEVPLHLEAHATQRWLRRNTTHFIQIIIPRMPAEKVFRLAKV